MKVPLLDLQPQYASIRSEVLFAITRVCDSQHFIMGPAAIPQLTRDRLERVVSTLAACLD